MNFLEFVGYIQILHSVYYLNLNSAIQLEFNPIRAVVA